MTKDLFEKIWQLIEMNDKSEKKLERKQLGTILGVSVATISRVKRARGSLEAYQTILAQDGAKRKKREADMTEQEDAVQNASEADIEEAKALASEIIHGIGEVIRGLIRIRDAMTTE